MKKSSELSMRYARALMSLADSAGQLDETLEELVQIAKVFEADPEIIDFVTSPVITHEAKEGIISKGFNGDTFQPNTKLFLKLLAQKDRFQILPSVLTAFQELIDEKRGVLRGTVTSLRQLTSNEKQTVETQISKTTGAKVILDYEIEKDVVGGLRAQVGTYTFDDTLMSHLNRMNEELNRRTL